MADKVNPKQAAMALGAFAAIVHLVWAIVIAIGLGQWCANFVLGLHFFGLAFTVLPFNAVTALGLVVFAFVGGCVLGYVLAYLWNWAKKFK